jgi:hypothetical protein
MQGRGAADAALMLVQTSNGRSGHDNITCTVFHYGADAGSFNPATRPTTIQSVVATPKPRKKKSSAGLAVLLALLGVVAAVIAAIIYMQMAGGDPQPKNAPADATSAAPK